MENIGIGLGSVNITFIIENYTTSTFTRFYDINDTIKYDNCDLHI